VNDELMGHERRRGELDGGSRVGARCRHTTPDMAARVAAAIEDRLALVLRVAEEVAQADRSASGSSRQGPPFGRVAHGIATPR
jgi:hypothetical protein